MPRTLSGKFRFNPWMTSSLFVPAAALLCAFGLFAQAPEGKGGGKKGRAADAKPSGPAPVRDITGLWTLRRRGYQGATFSKDEPAMTEWGLAKYKEAKPSNGGAYTLETTNDPVIKNCAPPGVPRIYFHPFPIEFLKAPKYIAVLYEYDHMVRRIYTDGRPMPKDPDPSWMGYSIGHWENDTTFVVETAGFNDKTWLDRIGHAHSTELHVTETFRRLDHDHMDVDITMVDPKALAKPWKATFPMELKPNWEESEISCAGDYLTFPNFEK